MIKSDSEKKIICTVKLYAFLKEASKYKSWIVILN